MPECSFPAEMNELLIRRFSPSHTAVYLIPKEDIVNCRRHPSFSFCRFWSLLILCFMTALAHAQVDQGTVTGSVRDSQEHVIAGAIVTLVNTDTGLTLTLATGDAGMYTFTPIKIGNYNLTVSALGFATEVRNSIHVDVSQTVGLNIRLHPGATSETVTVTADTALQSEQASTGETFSAVMINDMPLDGRNYVFAAQLTTGVAAPNQGFRQVAGAGDFTSNGNRVSQNNFVLDGVDNNSNMQDFLNGATYAVRPPPDALAEFKVESSDYSAELGRSTGAAINAAIKSGSNTFHGSLWEYLRNDRMDALDYFSTSRTAYHENLFGATIGGPIWKNKIFFFGDGQGTRISNYVPPQPNYTVPTALERTGDFSEQLDPANTSGNGAIYLYQRGGNVTTTVGGTDAPGFAPRYLACDGKQNVGQIIDNLTKIVGAHTLKAGINFQHVRFYGLQPPNGIGYQNFSGVYTSDPGQPNAVTGSGAADFLLDLMNNSGMNTVTPFTDLRWYYSAFLQDDWKVTPRLTVNLGLRWEYSQPIRELHDEQANFFGTYAGMNQGTGTYLIPEKQSGFPISSTLASTFAANHISTQYTSNESLVHPRKVNFAPRIGVSYLLDPKTVLRAGGGIFYGGLENIGLGLNLANNAPFFVNASFVPTPNQCYNVLGNVNCPTNGQTLETGFGSAANDPAVLANASGIGTIYAQDQNAKSAYTTAYNLSLQHSLTNTLSFTLGYQGNQSRHLRVSYNANTFAGYVPRGEDGQDYQPFHDFSVVNVASAGIGRYDSLQAKLDKQYHNGLYFLAGYTWSHCLDDAFGPIGQCAYGGYRNPNLLGFRYDYGNCTQDVRNRVTLNGQYELPFGRGRRFANKSIFTDTLIGQWKTSLTFQAQSGDPVFLNSSNQGSSYPIRVIDPMSPGGTADAATQPQFNCATKTGTLSQWFNPCAFKNPPRAVLGATDPTQNFINVAEAGLQPSGPRGRQSVVGPGFNRVDVSLFKNFVLPLHETNLQLRADGFNVLNHPSFSNPGTSLTGETGQAITSTRFSSLIPDARVIQVAARVSF